MSELVKKRIAAASNEYLIRMAKKYKCGEWNCFEGELADRLEKAGARIKELENQIPSDALQEYNDELLAKLAVLEDSTHPIALDAIYVALKLRWENNKLNNEIEQLQMESLADGGVLSVVESERDQALAREAMLLDALSSMVCKGKSEILDTRLLPYTITQTLAKHEQMLKDSEIIK